MSVRLEITARDLIDWIRNNVGDTDDWPASFAFDDDWTAAEFVKLLNMLEEAVEDSEKN